MSQQTSKILSQLSHRAHAIAIRVTFLSLVVTVTLLIRFSVETAADDSALSAGHWAAVALVQLWLLYLAVGFATVMLRIYRRMA